MHKRFFIKYLTDVTSVGILEITMNKTTLSEELTWRGFVNQTTFTDITDLDGESRTLYFGVDPSSDSMQVGNLAAAMMVRHFINAGYKAFILVGGATGYIGGDPDGKNESRPLKALDEVAHNKAAIAEQYKTVFAGQDFTVVDNYDWFKNISYLDFLRNVGNHVPMSQMLGRDFVQTRLEGNGINYAEFSYSLIQGYDFLHLFREHGVTLQLCGADQWGNSIAGVELIRRITGEEAHVYSTPLVMNKATGKKFGKSEDGVVWLDAKKTSPYQFYQFWLNSDDEGVEDYLKIFTLLPRDEIEQLMAEFNADRRGRLAQKKLAHEVTKLIHGQTIADEQILIAKAVAEQAIDILDERAIETLAKEIPVANVNPTALVVDVLFTAGLASSKSEARQFVKSGAVYVNGQPYAEEALNPELFTRSHLFLRRGKVLKNTALVTSN
jgi:tyrosyl-tRNA synthetase